MLTDELTEISEKYGVKQFSFDNGTVIVEDENARPKNLSNIEKVGAYIFMRAGAMPSKIFNFPSSTFHDTTFKPAVSLHAIFREVLIETPRISFKLIFPDASSNKVIAMGSIFRSQSSTIPFMLETSTTMDISELSTIITETFGKYDLSEDVLQEVLESYMDIDYVLRIIAVKYDNEYT